MATNPYKDQAGSEAYAYAWDMGHAYGQEHPTEQNPAAPGFYPPWDLDAEHIAWMNQVWGEGALAGQGDITPNIPAPHADHNAVSTAGHVVEGGAAAYDIGHGVVLLVEGGAAAGALTAGAIGVFVLLIGLTSPPPQDQAEAELHQWFADRCEENNCTDFFVACVWPDTYQTSGWYGHLQTSFDPAKKEAEEYLAQHAGTQMHIAHYSAASAAMLEIMDLVPQQ